MEKNMEKITYPVYGIISALPEREVNYLITEKEYLEESFRSEKEVEDKIVPVLELSLECFHEARKYVLKNEKELLDFIHGKYNDTKKAEENPEWNWRHAVGIYPNEEGIFRKAIKELGLSCWNLNGYYRGEQPVTCVQSRVAKGSLEFANFFACFWKNFYKLNLYETLEVTGLALGEGKRFHIDVESVDETMDICFYVTRDEMELKATVTRRTADGIEAVPFGQNAYSLAEGRAEFYEYSPDEEFVIRKYIIDCGHDGNEVIRQAWNYVYQKCKERERQI